MAEVKISVIGAGSAVFSVTLISELCATPNLEGSTISLMDINRERLDAAHSLCKRYAEEMNVKLKIEKTMDRRESLKDADFVINVALAAGHKNEFEGQAVARKHGYNYGGSFHIMHDEAFWINFYQFRLFESILGDMLDICPNAWYIQLSNPIMAGITYLCRKYREANIIGLCTASTGEEVYWLAEKLGLIKDHTEHPLPPEEEPISFQMPGVNHFIWLTHFYYRGENVFPILDEWIKREEPGLWETLHAPTTLLISLDLYKRFRVFPIGDTCSPGGGAWPWWYYSTEESKKKWKLDPEESWRRYYSHVEENLRKLLKIASDPSIKVSKELPPAKARGIAAGGVVSIIESMACGIPRVFQVNILNTGDFVPGVPRDFEVEVPALVSRAGIQGIKTHGLPKPLISYILRDRVTPVNIELEAYERGSKDLLLQLIMMDPWTRSEEQARKFLEDILNLPFNKEMKEHYK